MKTTLCLLAVLALIFTAVRAQTTTATSAMEGTSARQAYEVAKDGVDASLRSRVVSLYGTGRPDGIETWWVMFYDPSTSSHGRAVRVENGKIIRTYAAKGGVVYDDNLTFDPAQIHGIDAALTAARNYAARQDLHYSRVRALLRLTSHGDTFRWRIQMLEGSDSRGFVFVNANDGTFALYAPPGTPQDTGSVTGDVRQAGRDIKNTFLGVGGDLQQFFTGERTVDR